MPRFTFTGHARRAAELAVAVHVSGKCGRANRGPDNAEGVQDAVLQVQRDVYPFGPLMVACQRQSSADSVSSTSKNSTCTSGMRHLGAVQVTVDADFYPADTPFGPMLLSLGVPIHAAYIDRNNKAYHMDPNTNIQMADLEKVAGRPLLYTGGTPVVPKSFLPDSCGPYHYINESSVEARLFICEAAKLTIDTWPYCFILPYWEVACARGARWF